ncbi:MAG: hypothetical protein WBP26_00290 [Candidatus Saccharimonadales bacterium]
MVAYKKSALTIIVVGSIVSAVMAAGTWLFMNPPQCPTPYNQQQINESGCVVGANIGLAIMLFWALLVFAGSASTALIVYVSGKRKYQRQKKNILLE